MEQTPAADPAAHEADSRELAIRLLMDGHRLTEADIFERFTGPQIDACAELLDWYFEKDGLLLERAVDNPACWGGHFRIGPDGYVTPEAWDAVLPTGQESNLYYAVVSALDGDLPLNEVASHEGDEEWLGEVASEYAAGVDAEVYYTEAFPSDYTPDEQRDLASERPDLFTAEQLAAWDDLIDPEGRGTDGLDLDAEASDVRGIADGLASRQVESPGLDGRDR